MAEKLVAVIVDDRGIDSRGTTKELETYLEVHHVSQIDEVAAKLAAILARNPPIVDLILADINMEEDRSASEFQMDLAGRTVGVKPIFEMAYEPAGGEESTSSAVAETGSAFKPYGPILALPFTQFFSGGGVLAAVSAFWKDKRLIDLDEQGPAFPARAMNGYVYATLRLIWDQAEPHMLPEDRKTEFGKRLAEAYLVHNKRSDSAIIRDQAIAAVKQRRRQLLEGADAIKGLDDLSLDTVDDLRAVVTIWRPGLPMRRIYRSSLFADFCLELPALNRSAARFRESAEHQLCDEVRGYRSVPDFERLRAFSCAFADVLYESQESQLFAQRYVRAIKAIGGADPTIPHVTEPRLLPTYLRRYIILTAQLQLYSEYFRDADAWDEDASRGHAPEEAQNAEVCKKLGLADHDHTLKRFVLGHGRYRASDSWLRPFWSGPSDGWQGFNLWRNVDDRGSWDWTDLDRWVAQELWRHLDMSAPLPVGLGDPVERQPTSLKARTAFSPAAP